MANSRLSMKRKHVPVRTCVVCRSQGNKRAFTRLVRTDAGIMVDPTGKMNGRGAYLCDKLACWKRAATTNVLGSALKTNFTDADRIRLQQAIAEREPG